MATFLKWLDNNGMGVISMTFCGGGTSLRQKDRQAAMRFAFMHAGIDCATFGFNRTQEIDEAVANKNLEWSRRSAGPFS